MTDKKTSEIDELAHLLGSNKVTVDPEVLASFSGDMSPVKGVAVALVRPENADDVATTVIWANRTRTPVVARGGGSSLEGESVPIRPSVVIDFSSKMNRLMEVDTENLLAVVEPGTVNRALNRELEHRGVFFPPNPGSWEMSTIGGNVATNAAGPRCFKYGSTRNWVAAIEAVLGDGSILSTGTKARKSTSGLDLVRLMVGSEGTLGIFTKITLRLAPLPEKRMGVIAPFASFSDATEAVIALALRSKLGISAIEFVDDKCISALNRVYSASLPESPATLMIEIEGTTLSMHDALTNILEVVSGHSITSEPVYEEDVNGMWDLRGRITFALEKVYGKQFREDLAVPVTRFTELVTRTRQIFRNRGLDPVIFGHAGDGNIHLEFDHTKLGEKALDATLRELYLLAVSMGGTISGEHGIGYLKRKYFEIEHSPEEVAIMRAIKRVFDPNLILNPEKLYE
jgi:glycolate oxidase